MSLIKNHIAIITRSVFLAVTLIMVCLLTSQADRLIYSDSKVFSFRNVAPNGNVSLNTVDANDPNAVRTENQVLETVSMQMGAVLREVLLSDNYNKYVDYEIFDVFVTVSGYDAATLDPSPQKPDYPVSVSIEFILAGDAGLSSEELQSIVEITRAFVPDIRQEKLIISDNINGVYPIEFPAEPV